MRIHIDFETRSTVELPDVGAFIYAQHPDTEVILARYCLEEDDPIKGWRMGEPCPPDLREAMEDESVTLVAHNAPFEWHMIELNLSARHDWPKVSPERLDCTAARAAMMSLPRALGGAAKALGLPIEKDAEGRRLMLQMCKPRKARKSDNEDPDKVYYFEDEDRMNRLDAYCERDVAVERELDKILAPMSKRERAIWLLDFKINYRGVRVDKKMVEEADKVLNFALGRYDKEIEELTEGAVTTANQVSAFKKWLIPRLPEELAAIAEQSLDKVHLPIVLEGMNELVMESATADDMVTLRALEIRQETAKSSTAKLAQFRRRTAADGRMRENLMYHGAGTGRWSGKGVQLQNLPRPTLSQTHIDQAVRLICDTDKSIEERYAFLEFFYGPVPAAISSCLRACITATDKDHRLVVADYSNIEGRVNAHCAGQLDLVALFAEDGPVYETMAAKIFNIPVEDVHKGSEERSVGKAAFLGCGYQMGGNKFHSTCQDAGIDISEDMAAFTVKAYREANPKIKDFWYGMERAAIDAMHEPGSVTEFRDFKFHLTPDKSFLVMVLPCKRRLYYPNPQLKKTTTPWGAEKDQVTYAGTDPYTRQWVRLDTYGGKLVENAVQATARDLLAEAMIRVDRAGLEIVLTVHDEIVCDVPADRCDGDYAAALAELEQIMCEVPVWAEGCPVAAEGYHYDRFKK